jgi:predicted MFS family arabinose efflux permease
LLVDLLWRCAMSKAVRIGATFFFRFARYAVVSSAASLVERLAVIREPMHWLLTSAIWATGADRVYTYISSFLTTNYASVSRAPGMMSALAGGVR